MMHEISPKKLNITFENKTCGDNAVVMAVRGGELLLKNTEELAFLSRGEFEALKMTFQGYTYLFSISETEYFLANTGFAPVTEEERKRAEEAGYVFLRPMMLRRREPMDRAYAAALTGQIAGWYSKTQFCGRCGEKTVHDDKERMMRCPKCGNMIFPQICPSVIVGIIHNEKLLVTQYNPTHLMFDASGKTFKPVAHEALVAGYIEVGESAEDAVRREVMEEVGLKATNIRYYKNSPWPMSGSFLLGFLCDVEGDDTITLEEAELSHAVFKSPEELAPRDASDRSLTSEIIEGFRTGRIR